MLGYSNRLAWSAAENSFSVLLAKLRQAGVPLLDLTVSNPTEAFINYPHSEIAAALGAIPNFTYRPEAFGNPGARAAIARYMQRRIGGAPLPIENIALTASTSEAYSVLFKLLADPGDEVLVPTPSYPLFDFLAQLEGVNLRPYRLAYDGSWYIDFASFQSAITDRTRAIILVNPNNPTGSFLKIAELERLHEFGLPLISDEVFMDYAFEDSSGRVPTLCGQQSILNFTLNGLSKAAAMPQMKLGWITVNGPAVERQRACARLELILDTYLSVGAPVQLAIEPLLKIGDTIQQTIRARLKQNLSKLARLHVLHLEGGWSAVLRVPNVITEEEWITRLAREHQVIVQPGYFFDMPGEAFLVVSLLTEESIFAEGISRLLTLLNRECAL